MPRTKIIATLGPASNNYTVLRKMFAAGLDIIPRLLRADDVARFPREGSRPPVRRLDTGELNKFERGIAGVMRKSSFQDPIEYVLEKLEQFDLTVVRYPSY